jgi:hypothetical protein
VRWPALLAAAVLPFACGRSVPEVDQPPPAAGFDTTPPPRALPSACPLPQPAPADGWPVGEEQGSSVHLACTALECAVVWTSGGSSTSAKWVIHLARLTPAGARAGAIVDLDTTEGPGLNQPPATALASDGTRYLACWETNQAGASEIRCAHLSAGSDQTRPAPFRGLGSSPNLTAREGALLLEYRNEQVELAPLDGTGASLGPAIQLGPRFSADYVSNAVATAAGFVLVLALPPSGELQVQPLTPALVSAGPPTAFPHTTHGVPKLFPSGDESALVYTTRASLLDPYALAVTAISAEGATDPEYTVALPSTESPFRFVGAGHPSGLAVVWRGPILAEGAESLVFRDLALDGMPLGDALPVGSALPESTDTVEGLDIAAVGGGFLLAAIVGAPPASKVAITLLACP